MKKSLLLIVGLLGSNIALADMSYECWRYVDGDPKGYVKVSASSNDKAVEKAEEKFDDLGKKVHYIKCK